MKSNSYIISASILTICLAVSNYTTYKQSKTIKYLRGMLDSSQMQTQTVIRLAQTAQRKLTIQEAKAELGIQVANIDLDIIHAMEADNYALANKLNRQRCVLADSANRIDR